MVLYKAYFDASGTGHDTHAMFMSGFIATERKWRKWESAWLALLAEYGIKPPFHTTEFETRRGQFREWPNELRESFRLAAIRSLTPPRLNKAFSYGIAVEDLRRLFREFEMPSGAPSSPYAWCGLRVTEMVGEWGRNRAKAGRVDPGERYAVLFEHGDTDRGRLEAVLSVMGLCALFPKKRDAVAFQACDFLAWQHRNWLTQRTLRGRLNATPAVQEIARCLAKDSLAFHSWDHLVHECERQGIQRRV